MVLIEKDITKAMTMLENLLMNCVEEKTIIRIHGNVNGIIIRYTSALEDFFINQDEINLICGWFELNIQKIITEIRYSEEENSVHILFSEGELYLDLE